MSPPTVYDILAATAEWYDLGVRDLLKKDRRKPVALARQIAMYLACVLTEYSLPVIGRAIGGRAHTTILLGVRHIHELRDTDPELDAVVLGIECNLMLTGAV